MAASIFKVIFYGSPDAVTYVAARRRMSPQRAARPM